MTKKFYVYDGKKHSREEMENLAKISTNYFKKDNSPRFSEAFKMLEGKDILDVGCASGNISKYIAEMGYKVYGIDTLQTSIEIANEFFSHPNATYEVRDMIKQPFAENSFDCILFFETIEHVENPAQYLREFHRILRPKGCLILSTPNATSLKNMFYALSYRKRKKRDAFTKEIISEQKHTGTQLEHIYNWDFPVLIRLLDMCGFEHVDHKFTGGGPVVIPFFGKKIQLIKRNSKILRNFEPLMTTHVIKARKKIS